MTEFAVWVIMSFFTVLGMYYIYYKFTDAQKKIELKNIILFIVGVLIAALLNYFNIKIINTISYYLICPILFCSIKYENFKNFVFYVIIIWLYGILLDCLTMLILAILYYVLDINVYSDIFVMLPSLFIFFAIVLLANNKKVKKLTNMLCNLFVKIKYSDLLLIVFVLFIFIVGCVIAVNIRHLNVGLLAWLLIMMTVFVFILLLISKYNEFENNLFIQTLKTNNNFYVAANTEYSVFKHNLIAKMLSVKSVSNKKARILIDDVINAFNNNIDYSREIKDIPYGLNGIINQKLCSYADKIEIKLNNNVKRDIFDVLKPRRYNVLVEKLMILLDNAIDSCLKSVDKILIINLYEDNNSIIIEIKNTFSGDLDVEKLGESNYSTKGQKRGFGLYSALRNTEVSTKVNIVNNMFVVKLIAKNQS